MSEITNLQSELAVGPLDANPNGGLARSGGLIWAGLAVPWGALITYLAVDGAFELASGRLPELIGMAAVLPMVLFFCIDEGLTGGSTVGAKP